jgi:peptidyl-prolyl cis-trans isomerase D
MVAYNPERTLALTEVKNQVRERLIAARSIELAKKEGAEKLALWKTDTSVSFPAPVVISRDQSQNTPSQIVIAALRADTTTLPLVIGVELGNQGYAVVKINKIVPRAPAVPAALQQDRNQYAKWWTSAEGQAYYAVLKERLKAEILVPSSPVAVSQTP